nr:hypothetical protein CFP56_05940 [Quercus suber]
MTLADDMAKLQVQLFDSCPYYPPESHHVYREPQSPFATRSKFSYPHVLHDLTQPNQRSRFIWCGYAGKFTHFRPDIHGLVSFPVIVEDVTLNNILKYFIET